MAAGVGFTGILTGTHALLQSLQELLRLLIRLTLSVLQLQGPHKMHVGGA